MTVGDRYSSCLLKPEKALGGWAPLPHTYCLTDSHYTSHHCDFNPNAMLDSEKVKSKIHPRPSRSFRGKVHSYNGVSWVPGKEGKCVVKAQKRGFQSDHRDQEGLPRAGNPHTESESNPKH